MDAVKQLNFPEKKLIKCATIFRQEDEHFHTTMNKWIDFFDLVI